MAGCRGRKSQYLGPLDNHKGQRRVKLSLGSLVDLTSAQGRERWTVLTQTQTHTHTHRSECFCVLRDRSRFLVSDHLSVSVPEMVSMYVYMCKFMYCTVGMCQVVFVA